MRDKPIEKSWHEKYLRCQQENDLIHHGRFLSPKKKNRAKEKIDQEEWVSDVQIEYAKNGQKFNQKMSYWVEKGNFKIPVLDDSYKEIVINHIDNSREMTEKGLLIENLRMYYGQNKDAISHFYNVFDSTPITFVVNRDKDVEFYKFIKRFKEIGEGDTKRMPKKHCEENKWVVTNGAESVEDDVVLALVNFLD